MRNAFTGFTLIELPKAMRNGFTIIELLVVITIIVVLLALLTPALDKAIYQAELMTCSTRLDFLTSAIFTYALENRRFYPERTRWNQGARTANVLTLRDEAGDDRPRFAKAFTINLLNDPLCPEVNLETTQELAGVYASYMMWWGPRAGATDADRSMTKMGDKMIWDQGLKRSGVVIGDKDQVRPGNSDALSGHYDHPRGLMTPDILQDTEPNGMSVFFGGAALYFYYSHWQYQPDHRRPPLDLNYATDDGAVHRYNQVLYEDDPRMHTFGPADKANWTHLPK